MRPSLPSVSLVLLLSSMVPSGYGCAEDMAGKEMLEAVSGVDGLLRTHPVNGRYLTNDSGSALLLTGSHSWSVFQDYKNVRDAAGQLEFGYDRYLDDLERWDHNFFRGWHWEDTDYSPTPYVKVNGSQYDLDRPNPEYVERLRERLIAADTRGVYASVMLFQGWSVTDKSGLRAPGPWPRHPFREGNEVHGLGLGGGNGKVTHTLDNRVITNKQKAWVRHLVTELNDLDNIIWEISNESHAGSIAWQYEMIDHVREVESGLPKQHLVWMSCAAYGGKDAASNEVLFESSADIVSPCLGPNEEYADNPPVPNGLKVVFADSDHLNPAKVSVDQLWRGFTRGMHPQFMDWYTPLHWWSGRTIDAATIPGLRQAVGTIRRASELEDLAQLAPQSRDAIHPVSSRFALFSSNDVTARESTFDGRAVLAYAPRDQSTLDVCGLEVGESYSYTWYQATDGSVTGSGVVPSAGDCRSFRNPRAGLDAALLYLRLGSSADPISEPRGVTGAFQPGSIDSGGDDESAYGWSGRDNDPDQHDSSEADG